MAGDWIKLQHATPRKPEVLAIAARLGISRFEALGLLCEMWIWADQNAVSCNADVTPVKRSCTISGVTAPLLDSCIGHVGLAEAAAEVGWLIIESGGVSFPHVDRHITQTSKSRALTADRVANHREEKVKRSRNGTSVTDALPEKRREEKSITSAIAEVRKSKNRQPDTTWDTLCREFNLKPVTKSERSRVGKLVRDLKLKLATPADIEAHIAYHREHWPNVDCTPESLLKHWDQHQSEMDNAGPNGQPIPYFDNLANDPEQLKRWVEEDRAKGARA